ncbi:MAG: prenyltransferase/squalene oxidase repeat-containing protein [Nitrososphaerota archaeon]
MHEAGRISPWTQIKSFDKRSSIQSRVKAIINYIINRQNDDGGYAFCKGTDSNAQDTYYGLAILKLLKAPFPNLQKTINWLNNFVPDNLYSYFYIAKSLKLCDQEINKNLKNFLLSLEVSNEGFGTLDVYVEVSSEFEATFMITELINMLNLKINNEKIIKWLLKYQNNDGGFGAHEYSNLSSTYHAIASLFNLGYPIKSLTKTLEYVRSCEKPSGGFTVVPDISKPYMEHTYYGTMIIDLFGENLKYPENTSQFVLNCQNSNGGFARSEFGISTFEDTFYAVNILRKIGKI